MDNSNLRRAIYSQLYVMRAQIDSIIIMVEELEKSEDERCVHPLNQRENYTTMGGPENWKCKLCGYEFIER